MSISLPTSLGGDFGRGSLAGDDAIAVAATADSIIRTLDVPRGASRLYFEVKNSHAGTAFDQFTIKRLAHADGSFETLADASGDYTSPQDPILEVSADPVALAAAATVKIRIDVVGAVQIQILASGNGGVSEAELYYEFGGQ